MLWRTLQNNSLPWKGHQILKTLKCGTPAQTAPGELGGKRQLTCGLFHLHKHPQHSSSGGRWWWGRGWGLSKSSEREGCLTWQSPTFFHTPQPSPHLPVNHCSGNPRQNILSSNNDVKVAWHVCGVHQTMDRPGIILLAWFSAISHGEI